MPSVYRENYRDPRTGKLKKRRKYTVKYRVGPGRWKRVSGYRDKESSITLGKNLEIRAAREAQGLVDPFEKHATTELEQHIKAFVAHLRAKGDCDYHLKQTEMRVRNIVNACGFERIIGISASAVEQYLTRQRAAKKFGRQTSNYYLGAFKSFCRWLVNDRRAASSPVNHLKPMNTEGHQTFERRSLRPEEFAKLIEAARSGKMKCNQSGEDRAMIYMVASYTGFRANELSSVTPESFDFESEQPSLTVEAGYSKRRRKDTQAIRSDLAALLKEYIKGKPAGTPIWPGKWHDRAAEMLKVDLKAAGIAPVDERGKVIDFHALRHTYITLLHRGGTYGRVLQAMARHSTPALTARYTHVEVSDVDAALSGLPPIPKAKIDAKEGRKTA